MYVCSRGVIYSLFFSSSKMKQAFHQWINPFKCLCVCVCVCFYIATVCLCLYLFIYLWFNRIGTHYSYSNLHNKCVHLYISFEQKAPCYIYLSHNILTFIITLSRKFFCVLFVANFYFFNLFCIIIIVYFLPLLLS